MRLSLRQKLVVVKYYYRNSDAPLKLIMDQYNSHPFSANQKIQEPRTIKKIIDRFEENYSLVDPPRKRTKPATNEDMAAAVIASAKLNPHITSRKLAEDCGISQSSVIKILHKNVFHPYKMQYLHLLNEDDPDRRIDFCEWALDMIKEDQNWVNKVVFGDECTIFLNGEVNRQNFRYWSDQNPNWIDPSRSQSMPKINVWCGILGERILGPYFFERNIDSDSYVEMLESEMLSEVEMLAMEQGLSFNQIWWMHDGAPAHYAKKTRDVLDAFFPDRWIGRRGTREWPPRSPDFNPLDYFFWGYLKDTLSVPPKPPNIQALKNEIRRFCSSIKPETLQKVKENFAKRLQLCLDMDGNHFEQIIH